MFLYIFNSYQYIDQLGGGIGGIRDHGGIGTGICHRFDASCQLVLPLQIWDQLRLPDHIKAQFPPPEQVGHPGQLPEHCPHKFPIQAKHD